MSNKRKTTEQFKKEVYDLVGDEYTVLGEYVNCKTTILIKHNKCGYEWKILPLNFISMNHRCNNPKCKYERIKNTQIKNKENKKLIKVTYNNESFQKYLDEKYPGEFKLLDDFINTKTKIKLKHLYCNNIWSVTPGNIIYHNRYCPNCSKQNQSKNKRKTTEQFKKEVYDLVGDEYTVLGEYVNGNTLINFYHSKCKKEFEMRPRDFLFNNHRCSHCRLSKGEMEIQKYLNKKQIKFKEHYKFIDCKYKNLLEFDIYIPEFNICIEYDGEFHKKIIYYEKEYTDQKIRDEIKNKYCKEHKIKLIRINYTEFKNINKILNQQLNI
jgi:hypothetical protein